MPDGLIGVAWPRMRSDFSQNLDALGLLLGSIMGGYLISAFLSGALVRALGVGKVLGFSSLLTALALTGYTLSPLWILMLPLGMAAGFGAGAVDAGLNAYVESNFGESLMQWLHASFGIGVTLGPLLMTAGLGLSGSWRPAYLAVAMAQCFLGILFLRRAGILEQHEKEAPASEKLLRASFRATLAYPRAWLSAGLFYFYCGVELGIGHWAYTYLTQHMGISATLAGFWTGSYWGAFTLGRILAGVAARRIRARALQWTGMTVVFVAIVILALELSPAMSLGAIVLMGFAIAPVFPAMMSLTASRVGREHAGNTIGVQMSFAALGVGTLPGLIGVLAERWGLQVMPYALAVFALVLMGLNAYFAATKPSMDRMPRTPNMPQET
jgi:fucose permease